LVLRRVARARCIRKVPQVRFLKKKSTSELNVTRVRTNTMGEIHPRDSKRRTYFLK